MRAALLTAPRTIELVEQDLPPVARDDLRVRVTQCGVCTSELDVWTGTAVDEPLPAPIGHEVAGVVEEVGPDVVGFAPGDHVAVWVPGGGFAEAVLVPQRFAVHVAPGLAFPGVAEPLSCVVNAVELAAPRLGDDVVIVGAGFMGLLLLQVSLLKGPRSVTVIDLRADALEQARALGATHVLDPRAEDAAAAVGRIAAGDAADVAYEVTGVAPGLDLAASVTRMSGTLGIVGYHQGEPRPVPLGHWNWMAYKIANAHFRDPDVIMGGLRAGMRLVSAGVLDPTPLVTHRFALDQTADAFATAEAKPDGFVKAVVDLPA
jgi:2-desacetyl-2-hydroxyethyl bacteriochlorophyllide A dehydrogenase